MSRHTRRIDRRQFLRITGAASAASALGAATATHAAPEKATAPPNILWITVEDMSPTLGCYGDAYATTPHIDKLAGESVRYTHAFATAPVCSPVRSCLITGVLAASLGTGSLRSAMPIPRQMTGFPSYLRRAGYWCTNNVKTDYNTSNAGAIIKASWDQCSATAHWRGRGTRQPFFSVFNDMTSHQSRTMVWPYEQFRKQVQSRLSAGERHDPAKAPLPPYYPDTPVVRRTVARFHDCVTVMDKNVGRILKQLEDDGLADETIVFFYSDHGSGLPRHKRLVLDSGLHVPLLIRFPEKYRHLAPGRPGETIGRLVSFVDFPPTVLSLAGVNVPAYMQGTAFAGPAAGAPADHVYGHRDRVDEAFDLTRCVRDANWLYVRNYMPHLSYNQPSYYSDLGEIRDEITALAAAGKLAPGPQTHYAGPTRAREELYDTANDPHQIHNLAARPEHKARRENMRKLLRRWILRQRDLGFLPELDMIARGGDGTPYEMARGKDLYPLERILDAAELVGAGPAAMAQQITLLTKDTDPAVRYWAAVGLHALGRLADRATPALLAALSDRSAAVRIEAARALAELGERERALALLTKELEGADQRAALRAARALQMLGPAARPALPAMKRALAAASKGKGDPAMFLRFSLDPAVAKLEGK
jgi:N-sulfoglucosamine sulfohydrolase